jgi:hypothetical protein
MPPATAPVAQDAPAPIASPAEAEQLARHFDQVMEALLNVIEEETKLVRAGRLGDAAKLEQPKAELANAYLSDVAQMKTCLDFLQRRMPALLDAMRRRHDLFRALLQVNLTVLATAHAVAEGLVRGVSSELARKAAPHTYGASGRTNAPPTTAAQPMAVSRRL